MNWSNDRGPERDNHAVGYGMRSQTRKGSAKHRTLINGKGTKVAALSTSKRPKLVDVDKTESPIQRLGPEARALLREAARSLTPLPR